jgi:PAS domain S-box-containing protein
MYLQKLPVGVTDSKPFVSRSTSRTRRAASRTRVAAQPDEVLRALLEAMPDCAICTVAPDGQIRYWNQSSERLFGHQPSEAVGRSYSMLFVDADREAGLPEEHLAHALSAGHHVSEGRRVRRGGAVFDAHAVLVATKSSGAGRAVTLVVRDMTERKRLEADLRRRAEQLETVNRVKEEFLATLSHELRTPLNAILGWARLMRTGRLDDHARAHALETIERNAHIQEQLIADILDVSRIVTGKLRIKLQPIDFAPIVRAAVEAVRPAAEAKGVVLRLSVASPGAVMGDPDRLRQVVWNLLTNAIKFTPRGGTVSVSCVRGGTNAIVQVSDTGEGILPELLPFVFDRFRQGDASATRPHGGLGLGLSIVRHLIELHGGQVQVWSDGGGRGATFAVQLPIVPDQVAPRN